MKYLFVSLIIINFIDPPPTTGITGPRIHPVHQRMWLHQQRMQESHRRRLYPRLTTVHKFVYLFITPLIYQ